MFVSAIFTITLKNHPIASDLYFIESCASFDTKFDCIIYAVTMLCVILSHVLYKGLEIACLVIYKNAVEMFKILKTLHNLYLKFFKWHSI